MGPLLVDFELAQIGPAVFDLAPTVVLARRFSFPAASSTKLLRAYGAVDGAVLAAMVELNELVITCGAIGGYAIRHQLFREELRVRANSLGDEGGAQWTPHHLLLQRLPTPDRSL